jgi:hypothetical protein
MAGSDRTRRRLRHRNVGYGVHCALKAHALHCSSHPRDSPSNSYKAPNEVTTPWRCRCMFRRAGHRGFPHACGRGFVVEAITTPSRRRRHPWASPWSARSRDFSLACCSSPQGPSEQQQIEVEDRQHKERNLITSSLGKGLHATADPIMAGGLHPSPRGSTPASHRTDALRKPPNPHAGTTAASTAAPRRCPSALPQDVSSTVHGATPPTP